MKPILIFLFLLLLISCEKRNSVDKDLDTVGSYSYDYNVLILIKDGQGNDLLDPSNPKAFLQNKISLFYIKDGKKEQCFDWTNYLLFHIDDNNYHNINFLRLKLGYVNLLQWSQNDTDTIDCDFVARPYGYTLKAIKVNSKAVSLVPVEPYGGLGFTIIKN